MILMYGSGWDYDKWLCGTYGCDFEIELETSSYPEDEKTCSVCRRSYTPKRNGRGGTTTCSYKCAGLKREAKRSKK